MACIWLFAPRCCSLICEMCTLPRQFELTGCLPPYRYYLILGQIVPSIDCFFFRPGLTGALSEEFNQFVDRAHFRCFQLQAIKLLILPITLLTKPNPFSSSLNYVSAYQVYSDLIVTQQFKLSMRKHSLNHIGSHQHLKLILHPELAKKSHYFPESKLHRRQNTRPKKYEHRKEAICGSWLYESNKQNKNRNNAPQFGSKKGIKTTKKNSSSYIACNTSVQDTHDKNFQTFNFANLITNPNQIFKIPVAVTDADALTKQSQARGHLQTLYDRFRAILEKYREELQVKERRIKDLKKENKVLKEKVSKSAQRKG